jgi:hypothetical protein
MLSVAHWHMRHVSETCPLGINIIEAILITIVATTIQDLASNVLIKKYIFFLFLIVLFSLHESFSYTISGSNGQSIT